MSRYKNLKLGCQANFHKKCLLCRKIRHQQIDFDAISTGCFKFIYPIYFLNNFFIFHPNWVQFFSLHSPYVMVLFGIALGSKSITYTHKATCFWRSKFFITKKCLKIHNILIYEPNWTILFLFDRYLSLDYHASKDNFLNTNFCGNAHFSRLDCGLSDPYWVYV